MKRIIINQHSGLVAFLLLAGIFSSRQLRAQETAMSSYCNPLNLGYTYMIYNAHKDISYRSGADPAVVQFRNEYYMFVTRSMGYWHSTDLLNWDFISPEKWYFQGSNAPAAHKYKDSVLYVTGDPSGSMSILYTDDPKKGDWKATPSILNNLQDPDLFIDDDGKAYMYWGSSNKFPIRGMALDRTKAFRPSETLELFNLDSTMHGWERFGENHSNTKLGGYIEGPWMTKHNGKYYLQYAAPGTEFNVYGDGAYIGDHPLGPFTYMANNPFSYKPGGFMNGAGHGSTVQGPNNVYWHFASMAVSVNVNWERRICMFPTFFDKDGLMYSNTAFGDYPHLAPAVPPASKGLQETGQFMGWMLLSYNKPVTASSMVADNTPQHVVDENVKSFWLASSNDAQQWIEIDLQQPADVYAIQVNYHDYQSGIYGKVMGLRHQYNIEGSLDGKSWITIVDRTNNYRDVPNDYVELSQPQRLRFVRYKNIKVPTPNLAISGLRVFGIGQSKKPVAVKNFKVQRDVGRKDAMITWDAQSNCQGYNVYWGIAPDKLYNSWMVYGKNELLLKSLSADQPYYFSVEAFNENGVSDKPKAIQVQ